MKYFRTLKEARAYIRQPQVRTYSELSRLEIYNLRGKVYKYAVGTRFDWRCRQIG